MEKLLLSPTDVVEIMAIGVESSWLVRKGRKTSGPWEASKPAGNFRRAILRRQRWTEEASDAQSNA